MKAIECSFNPQFVINGFRVCGLYPFDENAIDFSKCIAGKKCKQTSDKPVPCPESTVDTVPVSRDLLNGLIGQISQSQAALYRAVEPDFFDTESEKIVCSLYKNVLQTLDRREFNDILDGDGEDDMIADEAEAIGTKEEFLER